MGKGKGKSKGEPRVPLFSVTLKDCDVQHFRAGGPGGQHQNKSNTGTRIVHRASGARGEARDSRSQHQNTRAAFIRMVETLKFKSWANQTAALYGRNIEQEVRDDMRPEKLRIEGYVDGEWTPIP
jgi:protein subunit release factor B